MALEQKTYVIVGNLNLVEGKYYSKENFFTNRNLNTKTFVYCREISCLD